MELVRQIVAVSGVLLLLAGALWWLRRHGVAQVRPRRGGRPRMLETVDRLALVPQHSLHLVRVGGRGLLVAAGPSGCTLLDSFDWAAIQPPALSSDAREVS